MVCLWWFWVGFSGGYILPRWVVIGIGRGHYGKSAMRKFSLMAFPPDLGGKNLWARERKFSPGFPPFLFSLYSQTEENSVFYPIFLPIFSILPKFHPTKHSVRVFTKESNWSTRYGERSSLSPCTQKSAQLKENLKGEWTRKQKHKFA